MHNNGGIFDKQTLSSIISSVAKEITVFVIIRFPENSIHTILPIQFRKLFEAHNKYLFQIADSRERERDKYGAKRGRGGAEEDMQNWLSSTRPSKYRHITRLRIQLGNYLNC